MTYIPFVLYWGLVCQPESFSIQGRISWIGSKGQEIETIRRRNASERFTKMNMGHETAKLVFQPIQSFAHSTSLSTLELFIRNCPCFLLNTTFHAAWALDPQLPPLEALFTPPPKHHLAAAQICRRPPSPSSSSSSVMHLLLVFLNQTFVILDESGTVLDEPEFANTSVM
jgi:hypothetical protein